MFNCPKCEYYDLERETCKRFENRKGAGWGTDVSCPDYEKAVGIELSENYVKMSEKRIKDDCGELF